MAITTDEIEREKAALPRGWGRFGKAIERLREVSDPDESLLASCVALNPEYRHIAHGGPNALLTVGNLVAEAGSATNIVFACTTERLILVLTGLGGAPRSNGYLPFEGTRIAEQGKKEFVLRHHGAEVRFRGAAKQPAARLLDVLAGRLATV